MGEGTQRKHRPAPDKTRLRIHSVPVRSRSQVRTTYPRSCEFLHHNGHLYPPVARPYLASPRQIKRLLTCTLSAHHISQTPLFKGNVESSTLATPTIMKSPLNTGKVLCLKGFLYVQLSIFLQENSRILGYFCTPLHTKIGAARK